LYSSAPVVHWEWCRSELELSRFMMHYIGAGTDFPFHLLQKSVNECKGVQPIRVVITDTDFDHNYETTRDAPPIFADACRVSPHLVLLLHNPDEQKAARYRRAGAKVIAVRELEDYPAMAASLSAALFEEKRHVAD